MSDAAEQPHPLSMSQARVMEAMEGEREPLSASQIAVRVFGPRGSGRWVVSTLQTLEAAGRVRRVERTGPRGARLHPDLWVLA